MPYHELMLGKMRCVLMPDGTNNPNPVDIAKLFPEKPEIQAGISTLQGEHPFTMTCLLIETAGQRILVDTGLGTLNPEHKAQLPDHLKTAGVTPEQIDLVVLTHGHGDHLGGVVDDAGKLLYPNAQHLMTQLEWDYWQGPAKRPMTDRSLNPLADRIKLIAPDAEIAPGVRAVPAPGHTPGHIGIRVESEGATLLHLVDAAHHPIQMLHPDWSPNFDADPVQAAATRRQLFAQAADEGCLVMTYHIGAPALGKIVREGDAFCYVAG